MQFASIAKIFDVTTEDGVTAQIVFIVREMDSSHQNYDDALEIALKNDHADDIFMIEAIALEVSDGCPFSELQGAFYPLKRDTALKNIETMDEGFASNYFREIVGVAGPFTEIAEIEE